MNHKAKESVGAGPIETSHAFLQSIVGWQRVMLSSFSAAHAGMLFTTVDLVAAATDLATAREWVSFLDAIIRGNEKIVAQAERNGASAVALDSLRMIGSDARSTQRDAARHVSYLEGAKHTTT